MNEPRFITGTVERQALLYSDNSAFILHEGCTIQAARQERLIVDHGERRAGHITHIAKVRLTIVETISDNTEGSKSG